MKPAHLIALAGLFLTVSVAPAFAGTPPANFAPPVIYATGGSAADSICCIKAKFPGYPYFKASSGTVKQVVNPYPSVVSIKPCDLADAAYPNLIPHSAKRSIIHFRRHLNLRPIAELIAYPIRKIADPDPRPAKQPTCQIVSIPMAATTGDF